MVDFRTERWWPFAFIGCNSLHYMGSTVEGEPDELRRSAIRTLAAHVAPGGLGVVSNVAPLERKERPEPRPAPYLVLMNAGMNPNTGRWTAEYQGRWTDGKSGIEYNGPWRFVEYLPDGATRAIEFAVEGEVMRKWPVPLTRGETVAMMREVGFAEVEIRSTKNLGPVGDADWAVVFLGRR